MVRDRIGFQEAPCFSSVFHGSGLRLHTLVRAVKLRVTNAYAIEMAGVLMMSNLRGGAEAGRSTGRSP